MSSTRRSGSSFTWWKTRTAIFNGYLQKLGERVFSQLPPTKIHYRFFIVDAPQLNYFGTAGGRIYIFRTMISFTQNEDELAALLGHEIGHIATHQSAIEFTPMFRELNTLDVGDRQDIFNKWTAPNKPRTGVSGNPDCQNW